MVYDAWNPSADYTRSAGVPPVLSRTYLWGTDLSGSIQGAGGVGGLLSVYAPITTNPLTFNSHFPTYDGNGNVSEYLDSAGTIAAHFEYDASGRMVASTGDASDFYIRFSTKKEDAGTGLNYYGYRYYNSLMARWLSRDPLEERGGVNLYGFVGNNPNKWVDYLGLRECDFILAMGHGTLRGPNNEPREPADGTIHDLAKNPPKCDGITYRGCNSNNLNTPGTPPLPEHPVPLPPNEPQFQGGWYAECEEVKAQMDADADRMLQEGLGQCGKAPKCCTSVKVTFRNLFGGDCPNLPADGTVLRGASCASSRP
jgi:RHS repeat-associated protein